MDITQNPHSDDEETITAGEASNLGDLTQQTAENSDNNTGHKY